MKNLYRLFLGLTLLSCLLFAKNSNANDFKIGDITIHYNVFNSTFLQPETATIYGIKRSKNRAILNISVVKNEEGEASEREDVKGIVSNVFGHGTNLLGQLKELAFKEIKEKTAIYYIASFPINNAERITFDLKVQPNKQGKLIPIKFKQQVFIE